MRVTECNWSRCKTRKSVPLVVSSNTQDYLGWKNWVQAVNIHNGATIYMMRGVDNTATMVLIEDGVKYTAQGKAIGGFSFACFFFMRYAP